MSKIRLHGSSSGYTEIAPVAASGNNTLTLPNDGTIISKDSNGAVGVTSITVGTGVTIGDGRVTCTTLHGSAANCTQIPAANIVGLCTAGFSRTGGFGGITDLDAWAISSNYDASSGSNIISANWYQYADRTSWPGVGSEMTESSGVFTFPKTGLWHIWFSVGAYNANNNSGNYFGGQVYYSSDSGSSYSAVTSSYDAIASNADHGTNTLWTYLDITNISTARVKFHTNVPASHNIFGDSSQWRTGAVFTRFGDT